jgi:hypothetical protein
MEKVTRMQHLQRRMLMEVCCASPTKKPDENRTVTAIFLLTILAMPDSFNKKNKTKK